MNLSTLFKKPGYNVHELYKVCGLNYCAHYECSYVMKKNITHIAKKLASKDKIAAEAIWKGQWYKKEICTDFQAPLKIHWIHPKVGWGVFAHKPIPQGQYISCYMGLLRNKGWTNAPINNYCFTFPLQPWYSFTGFGWTIDALHYGNLSRFINHSDEPNCKTELGFISPWPYVIIAAKRDILPGEQLCYDYGKAYWRNKSKSLMIENLDELNDKYSKSSKR